MNKNFKNPAQAGFTLIELIVVIVILGILAATALPRFVNMGSDARAAAVQGARGAMASAAGLAHAQAVTRNETTTTTMDGTAVALVNQYPTVTSIATAAQLDGFTAGTASTSTPKTITYAPAGATAATCSVTYTEATTTTPATAVATVSDCN